MSIYITQKVGSGGGGSNFIGAFNLFVDPNGSDSSGTGSQNNPFKTISHTISSISGASSTNQYVININSGTYTENIQLSPYVYLVGVSSVFPAQNPTLVIYPVNIVGNLTIADSAIGNFYLKGIGLQGSYTTYTTSTTASGVFFFSDCGFLNSGLITIGSSNTSDATTCEFNNCSFENSSGLTLNSCNAEIKNSQLSGTTTISGGAVYFTNTFSQATINLNDDSNSNPPSLYFFGGMSTSEGTISYSGTNGVQINTDSSFITSALGSINTGAGAFWEVYYQDSYTAFTANSATTLKGDTTCLLVTTGTSMIPITLPSADNFDGKPITIAKADSGLGHVVITVASGDAIASGGTTNTITTKGSVRSLISDGGNTWYIISSVGA